MALLNIPTTVNRKTAKLETAKRNPTAVPMWLYCGITKFAQTLLYFLLAFLSIYYPRNDSEIKGKITHAKQPRTLILSKL